MRTGRAERVTGNGPTRHCPFGKLKFFIFRTGAVRVSGMRLVVRGPDLNRRLDAAVETAAYFVIAEALTNVAEHSHARRCTIGLRHSQGTLRVWVTDDGVGGAALDKGHGLRGLDDRLHAADGIAAAAGRLARRSCSQSSCSPRSTVFGFQTTGRATSR